MNEKIKDLQIKLAEDLKKDIEKVLGNYTEACEKLGCQIEITGGISVIDYTGSRDKKKVICASGTCGYKLIQEIGKWHD